MYCISNTSSDPPVRSLGPRQGEELNMGVTNPWSNPSLEQCTWSLSEQSAACCIPASVDHGAFPRVCYCQTPACHLCKLHESQAQRRCLWSLEDRKWFSHFLRGHSNTWFPLYPDVQAGCKDVRGELPATPQGASAGGVSSLQPSVRLGWQMHRALQSTMWNQPSWLKSPFLSWQVALVLNIKTLSPIRAISLHSCKLFQRKQLTA